MKKVFLILTLCFSTILLAQNDGNTENRSKNTVKDSLMTNTYHLEKNQENIEPVSPTNLFQNPDYFLNYSNYTKNQVDREKNTQHPYE